MNEHGAYVEDELSLLDMINFFQRQKYTLLVTFVLLALVTLLVALSRPTVYLSEVDLLIGKNYYAEARALVEQANKPNEAIEQIKYIYGKQAEIENVRNTSIIKIKVKNSHKEVAENISNAIVKSIMDDEAKQVELKKAEFLALLKAIGSSNTQQALELVTEVSKSYHTKMLSSTTTKLDFGGQLKQILGIGFLLSLVVALFVALLKDQLKRAIGQI